MTAINLIFLSYFSNNNLQINTNNIYRAKRSIKIDKQKIRKSGYKEKIMANKSAKKALEQMKMQAASEVGVNLNNGYNGDLTARQAGSIGGQMVKKMIESYENQAKGSN
jgi:small acid-soluble spore protein D (minor alpha/beta-type SASP)